MLKPIGWLFFIFYSLTSLRLSLAANSILPDHTLLQADLVVVAYIAGLADQSPTALQRKKREAHIVEIKQTLAGHEVNGRRFLIKPNGADWQFGHEYILYLKWDSGHFATSLSSNLYEASQTTIAELSSYLQQNGKDLKPERVLYMHQQSGWQLTPWMTLSIIKDGHYNWHNTLNNTSGQGLLTSDQLEFMLETIEQLPELVANDDANTVFFEWKDSQGKWRTRRLPMEIRQQPNLDRLFSQIDMLFNPNNSLTR